MEHNPRKSVCLAKSRESPRSHHKVKEVHPNAAVLTGGQVFKADVQAKIKRTYFDLMSEHIFGVVAAFLYASEFRKRDLPHAYVFVTLAEGGKFRKVREINNTVSI